MIGEVRTYYLGSGKSREVYGDIARAVAEGYRVLLVVPNHVVGLEAERGVLAALRALGREDVSVVHPWSRLQDAERADGTPVPRCARSSELREFAEKIGGFQVGRVCVTCPHAKECPAKDLADSSARAVANKDAKVVITTEAGFDSLPQNLLDEAVPFADDIHEHMRVVNVGPTDFAIIGRAKVEGDESKNLWYVRDAFAAAARAIVQAWRRGLVDYGSIRIEPRAKRSSAREGARQFNDAEVFDEDEPVRDVEVRVADFLAGERAFDVVRGVEKRLTPAQQRTAKAVREILLLAKHGWTPTDANGGARPVLEVEGGWYRSPVYEWLDAREGTLLDGTPNRELLRLAGFEFRSERTRGYDFSANVQRVFYECGNDPKSPRDKRARANRESLMRTAWNGKEFMKRKKMRHGVVGVDWPRVLTAMHRAADAAARTDRPGAWAFFTYLGIEAVLLETTNDEGARVVLDEIERDVTDLAGRELERLYALQECRRLLATSDYPPGHFGAARSRNDWRDVVALSVLGTHFGGAHEQLAALGVDYATDRDTHEAATKEVAANELAQVVERSRSIRRVGRDEPGVAFDTGPSEPLWLFVEADVLPAGEPWVPRTSVPDTARRAGSDFVPVGSECRHESKAQTEARLAVEVERILADRGEDFEGDLASEFGTKRSTLTRARREGAIDIRHEATVSAMAPEPRHGTQASLVAAAPTADPSNLQPALRELVDARGVDFAAELLGAGKRSIYRALLPDGVVPPKWSTILVPWRG